MIIMRTKTFMKNKYKILLLFVITVFCYNEILIYNLQRFQWTYLPCHSKNCTRFLMVADPQIIGESFDTAIYSPFAIWDSDRYLKETFKQALYFSNPDIICFLGDLFDEGSAATDQEYSRYKYRFKSIFNTLHNRQKIYIPGDNDIGGENGDRITQKKIDRFRSTFKGLNIVEKNNVKIYKLNRISYEIPREDNSFNTFKYRIGISHYSILISPGTYTKMVMDRVNPHIIFSAHRHDSVKISNTRNLRHLSIKKSYMLDGEKTDVFNLDLKEFIYEIMIPTCSYRMGAVNVGYGVAVIDDNKLYYTVLWMPNRFNQLFVYIICVVLSFLIITLPMIFTINFVKICRKIKKPKSDNESNNV